MSKPKHRGEIVEEVIRKSGFSIKNLAERLHISRNTLYNRFREANLSYDFILEVGSIIHYNFNVDFPEIPASTAMAKEGAMRYLDHNTAERIKLEKKYIHLLERYNKALSIMVRLVSNSDIQALQQEIRHYMESHSLWGLSGFLLLCVRSTVVW